MSDRIHNTTSKISGNRKIGTFGTILPNDVCLGCGHSAGHRRRNCPQREHPDFCFSGLCEPPIDLGKPIGALAPEVSPVGPVASISGAISSSIPSARIPNIILGLDSYACASVVDPAVVAALPHLVSSSLKTPFPAQVPGGDTML